MQRRDLLTTLVGASFLPSGTSPDETFNRVTVEASQLTKRVLHVPIGENDFTKRVQAEAAIFLEDERLTKERVPCWWSLRQQATALQGIAWEHLPFFFMVRWTFYEHGQLVPGKYSTTGWHFHNSLQSTDASLKHPGFELPERVKDMACSQTRMARFGDANYRTSPRIDFDGADIEIWFVEDPQSVA